MIICFGKKCKNGKYEKIIRQKSHYFHSENFLGMPSSYLCFCCFFLKQMIKGEHKKSKERQKRQKTVFCVFYGWLRSLINKIQDSKTNKNKSEYILLKASSAIIRREDARTIITNSRVYELRGPINKTECLKGKTLKL